MRVVIELEQVALIVRVEFEQLGSLVARFLFKPVEEKYYVLFNKTFPRSMGVDGGDGEEGVAGRGAGVLSGSV